VDGATGRDRSPHRIRTWLAGMRGRPQAVALHRRAAATAVAAERALDGLASGIPGEGPHRDLAERLTAAAERLAPGWLGAVLDPGRPGPATHDGSQSSGGSPGSALGYVRVGSAEPLAGVRFPVVLPLLGTGHLLLDRDRRDPRVAGLLRSLLLRLLAAAPAGSLLLRGVDTTGTIGSVFAPFASLIDAGLLSPPATDAAGLRAVLAEAENWVRPTARGAPPRHDRTLLLVVAARPASTGPDELARIAALAEPGPLAGLHLIVAGWPAWSGEDAMLPAHSTLLTFDDEVRVASEPAGARRNEAAPVPVSSGWSFPVLPDPAPPPALIERVCRELSEQLIVGARPALRDLLPASDEFWAEKATDGLSVVVGHDGDTPVILRFNELTPHWLVGGRPGAGRRAFLLNVLAGLCTRYSPAELGLYLVDLGAAVTSPVELPDQRDPWLPHLRAAGLRADREYGLAVLRELEAELRARCGNGRPEAPPRLAGPAPRRLLCVLNEFPVLLAGEDSIAAEALTRLESLAKIGRSYGIHLILSRAPRAEPALAERADQLLGQFPIRVALPGGDVLEPTNDSAAGLARGTAVVNTAGGLGGPRRATRGHERLVRFPDPYAERPLLGKLRRRLRSARPAGLPAPVILDGDAGQRLSDDPTYQDLFTGVETRPDSRPVALLGRVPDMLLSTAALPLDARPGRHVAVLGPERAGAQLLGAMARSLAVQHTPGSIRFTLAVLTPEGRSEATALAAEVGRRHPIEQVDAGGVLGSLTRAEPGYVVLFGAEELTGAEVAADRLRVGLRTASAAGRHLLCWWRSPGPHIGAFLAGAEHAGLVLLPGALAEPVAPAAQSLAAAFRVTGVDRLRSGRALLHNRSTGVRTVIVPFTAEQERCGD
jgi:S-DNA-T family DNA segregation ATPase FtsK/SpoIIIE